MSVALKPKPMLPGTADAGAASSTATASTAGTSAITFIFIALPSCHRESVAHTAGDAAPAAPTKSATEHHARASVQTAGLRRSLVMSVSSEGDSEGGEWSAWVAAVVAQRSGEVDRLCPAERADDEVA